MADPLTIIGTVAAVLDLAEYATKVVSTALTIYEAPRGTTLENAALEDVVSNMDALLNSPSIGLLEKSANESEESDDKEKPNLLRLAQQCQCVCKQIMDMLATMRIDKSKSKSKPIVFLECVKATAKTVWKKGRVIELRTDLDFVTSQLHLHYSLATGTETIDKLNDLMSKGDINSNALAKIRRDLKSLQDHGIRLEAGSMDDLRDLLGYSEKALRQRFQDRVLRSLKFGDMTNRFEDVPTAAAETFEWVIQGSHIPDSSHPNLSMSFRDWLENGAGIFHISGQPGAGKSTLMKFICQNKETRKCLESWAAPKQLVAANFFFWKPGTNLQKSLVGLIRGILHSTLKQVPSLIPLIFEDVWDPFNTQTWPNEGESPAGTPFSTTQDAIDTFERLFNLYAKDNLNGQRFCFFIDGLDEFDDPSEMHTMLAHRLKQWTLSWPDTLKFCVSSRPLPSFEDGFSLQQRIYLHFLTAGDIRSAIQGFLQKHPRFRLMDIIERDGIITAVVRQAQGIFLWVDLVKREIWNGLDNHDSFEELMAEIETFPQGLDEFLRHILCSIRASDHRTAWAIFSVVLEMGEIHDRPVYAYPRAIHYSYIRDYIRDPGSSRKLPVKS